MSARWRSLPICAPAPITSHLRHCRSSWCAAFHHGAILYNTRLGIRSPKDLEGRRVGVNRGYTVTTGVWARSILQHEHGVDLQKITWVLSATST